MQEQLKKGDYVLATKYQDGDPQDQWCVGFYDSCYANGESLRHLIVDDKGEQFRMNGFRRVKKITKEQGAFFINNKESIEELATNIWSLLWHDEESINEREI